MKPFLITMLFLMLSFLGMAQVVCPTDPTGRLPNDDFPGCYICTGLFGGTTNEYTEDDIAFDFPCGEIENSQWFNFIAKDAGDITIKVDLIVGNKGIEVGLFDADLNLLGNCSSTRSIGSSAVINYSNIIADQPYFIMVDGIDGDTCKFSGKIEERVKEIPPSPIGEIRQIPNNAFCIYEEVSFHIDPVEYASGYDWELSSELEVIEGGEIQDTFVRVLSTNPQLGQMKVRPINQCEEGLYAVKLYLSTEVNFGSIGDMYYCFEDKDKLPADSCVTVENGCDSCYNFNFIQKLRKPIRNRFEFICSENCIMIGDSCYSEAGQHLIAFENYYPDGCDSLVNLTLRTQSIFPSPEIFYTINTEDVLLEWEPVFSADSYIVSIDRDSFTTTSEEAILIPNLSRTSNLYIKVQPVGDCTYLPGEININIPTNTDLLFFENKISIFPNPTSGSITIKTDLGVQEIEIYDATGRFLQKEETTSFDLKNRTSGIYFLKLKTNKGVAVKRVILN